MRKAGCRFWGRIEQIWKTIKCVYFSAVGQRCVFLKFIQLVKWHLFICVLKQVRLAGDHVIQSKATYDFVHNERAVAGKASFTGLRLLDVHSCVKLNITMKMPGYPHSRLPNTYTDNALKFVYDIAGKKKAFVYNGTSDPAVLISDCINVTGMNNMCLINFNIMP